MNKVLVTGCAGFIGSHLTERLLKEGCTVVGVDAFLENYEAAIKRRNLSQIGSHPRFRFYPSPLQGGDWRNWLDGVETVFHLAALPGVRSSWGKSFAEYLDHNLAATQQLLEACLQTGRMRKIIISSSSSVYGTMREHYTNEQAPLAPLSPYGVTKAAMEQLCRVYINAYRLPIVILRYFTVYGPRQRPDMAFHRFYRQIMCGEALQVYGDGRQTRDFTYVSDAVEANLLAAARGEPGDICNIGGNRETSLLEVIDIMSEIVGQKADVTYLPAQAGDSARTCADISFARDKLRYQPRVSLEQGLYLQLVDLLDSYRG
jgi:nucleoside-diphosphate-sugar epimerase